MSKYVFKQFSQSELDIEYNNRLRVPEVESLYKSWVSPSEAIFSDFLSYKDLSYGSSKREKIDLILPSGKGPHPVNLYFHGGYWMSRQKTDQTFIARSFVQSGHAMALIEYDLIPQVRMSNIIDQCVQAVLWLFNNSKKFNLDPNKIFISGHSAGGHIVSMLCVADWQKHCPHFPDVIKGVCGISGVYDLLPVQKSYMQEILCFTDEEVREFSSIRFKNIPKIPFIIAVGGCESQEFIRQSKDFALEWNKKGGNCNFFNIEDKNHFTILEDLTNIKSTLVKKIVNQMSI